MQKVVLPSLYENGLGAEWNSSKVPEDFVLNGELYGEMCENLVGHTIEELLRRKMPKLLNEALNNDVIIFNEEEE